MQTTLVSSLVLALAMSEAHALDMTGQGYVQQLTLGGPEGIRKTAQQMVRSRYNDVETLDVAAEVLLQNYTSTDKKNSEALAWVCKALASSGNGRYKATLSQVVDNTRNRKLRGHCNKAHKSLKSSGVPYLPGSINLNAYRGQGAVQYAAPANAEIQPGYYQSPPQPYAQPVQYQQPPQPYQQPAQYPPQAQYQAPPAHYQQAPGQYQAAYQQDPFTSIRQGMTMEEVKALLGEPAASFSHQTGKGWIPFNFQGKDVMRIISLYPGRGRITFNQVSVYSRVWRVMDVSVNPNETGRP
jgi:hypothetical protein